MVDFNNNVAVPAGGAKKIEKERVYIPKRKRDRIQTKNGKVHTNRAIAGLHLLVRRTSKYILSPTIISGFHVWAQLINTFKSISAMTMSKGEMERPNLRP